MSNGKLSSGNGIRKHEDGDPHDSASPEDKRDIKPIKILNRVPRACNACRKQKMRCEGAENPPCRRCRHAGLQCLFEKPSKEPNLTGEAGLERIRALEAQVAEVQQSQVAIHSTLAELVHHLRSGGHPMPPPAPFQPHMHQPSNIYHGSATPLSTPSSSVGPMMIDPALNNLQPPPAGTADVTMASPFQQGQVHTPGQLPGRQQSVAPRPNPSFRNSTNLASPGMRYSADMHPPQLPPNSPYPPGNATYSQGTTLPPISSLQDINIPRPGSSNISSMRYQPNEASSSQRQTSDNKRPSSPDRRSPKRRNATSSNVTSSNNSDIEDDDNGELPLKGLFAPLEVLRDLADVAIQRAAQESGDRSEPQSRPRSSSPDSKKPHKRRKTMSRVAPPTLTFPDVVSKKIILDAEARELFKIFYAGCSTFLPVFDSTYDTYNALHERSPFAFNAICMVAAKVRDGGGPQSETARKCLEEVQTISCATLFSPVSRQEAVQAMVLVSGWSDNGWLSGGHAVRMAVELSMHQAWPKLLKKIEMGKASDSNEDRRLIISTRTWFCLYLFEHQISYGTGRPAILKDDESIYKSRLLLNHPLSIEDDMRLCSTVELMAIRERIHNKLSNDGPVDEQTFAVLREADVDFRNWFTTWDNAFSQKYEDAAFYRQSLQIQKLHAELYHNATALRGIDGPEDVQSMLPMQRDLALASLKIAQQALSICVDSNSYREGLKYAVHYTHATATFTASFLLRLARLFPDNCDMPSIRMQVESLAVVLSEIPARRYAYTLRLMLKKSKKRRAGSIRSPIVMRHPGTGEVQGPANIIHPPTEPISPTYDRGFPPPEQIHGGMPVHGHILPPQFNADAANLDQIWRGFEGTSNEQLPVWLSDQSLGGNSFSQLGLEAFMMPPELDQRSNAPQIW